MTVISLIVAPRIRLPTRSIKQYLGKETILECKIESLPTAQAYWKKAGHIFRPYNYENFKNRVYKRAFKIQEVKSGFGVRMNETNLESTLKSNRFESKNFKKIKKPINKNFYHTKHQNEKVGNYKNYEQSTDEIPKQIDLSRFFVDTYDEKTVHITNHTPTIKKSYNNIISFVLSIRIKNLVKADFGTYWCVASNVHGITQADMTLKGKNGFSAKTLQIFNIRKI